MSRPKQREAQKQTPADVGVLNQLRVEVAPETATAIAQAEQVRQGTEQALAMATERLIGLLRIIASEKGHGAKKLQLVEVESNALVFRVEKSK